MQSIGQKCKGLGRLTPAPRSVTVVAPQHCLRRGLKPLLAAAADEFEFEAVSGEEAARFERIAAQLVLKMDNMKAEGGDEGDLDLLPFGAGAEEVAAAQAKIDERRQQSGAASTATASQPGSMVGSSVPRRQRRKGQIPMENLPKVAIVGRPNVGKSAMFNRIAGTSIAVVFDQPGVTRDRLYTRAFWGDKEFVLIDTGGLMSDATRLPASMQEAAMKDISADGLPSAIERQAAAGVAEADVVVLLADGQAGLQSGDQEILGWLRTHHPDKRVLLAVNKCENSAKADIMVSDFWEMGLEPIAVSAITGTGTGDLLDAISNVLPPPISDEEEDMTDKPLAIAIVGRPNVGKSSLLNAVCGEERSIVCDMSGTTRDAVDTELVLPSGQKLTLIDTAGIRKRTKVADSKDGPEQISVDRALRAMRRSEVVVMVIDGSEGITQQDYRLSELACAEGRAVVVVVNKWDRVDQDKWTVETYTEEVRAQLRHVSWATVVCTTANKGRRVEEVLDAILQAGVEHRRRVSTATLNLVLKEATAWKAPPTQRHSLKKGKIYYCTQATTAPPTFVFFVNDPKLLSDDYKRYMERQLRESIGFPGTPLRLIWRGKPETDRTLVVRPRKPSSSATSGDGGKAAGGRGSGGKGGSGGKAGRQQAAKA